MTPPTDLRAALRDTANALARIALRRDADLIASLRASPTPRPPSRSCLPRRVLGQDVPDCRRRRASHQCIDGIATVVSAAGKSLLWWIPNASVLVKTCPARGGAVTFLWRGKVRGDTPIMRSTRPGRAGWIVVDFQAGRETHRGGRVAYGPWRSSSVAQSPSSVAARSDGRIRDRLRCATHRRGRRDRGARMSADIKALAVPDV